MLQFGPTGFNLENVSGKDDYKLNCFNSDEINFRMMNVITEFLAEPMDAITKSSMITDLTVALRDFRDSSKVVLYHDKMVHGFDIEFKYDTNIVLIKPLDENSEAIQ